MSRRQAESSRAAGPPRYKLALLTWVGAYAVITAILAVLGPVMTSWPLVLRTLLLSVLMVIAMTWVVIPSLTRLFRAWLAPAPRRAARAHVTSAGPRPPRAPPSPEAGRGSAGA